MGPTAEKLLDDETARRAGGVPVQIGGQVGTYSLARALVGDGGFEREVGQELRGRLEGREDRGGLLVPASVLFPPRAALDTGTSTAGEELVFEDRPDLVPRRRPVSRVESLGAMLVRGGRETLAIVRVTAGGDVTWTAEVPGSPVSDDDVSVEGESLSLSQGMLSTAYSRQLQALNPETAALVELELRAAAAQAVDEGAVAGAGGDEPTGLVNRSDVPEHTISDPDGGAPTYSDIVSMEEAPAAADVDELAPGWLTTPEIRGTLRETEALSGSGRAIWFNQSVLGRRAEVSSTVPSDLTKGAGTDLHAILFGGDWSNLVVHVLAVEIVTDRFRLKKQGVVEATMFLWCGVGLRHPEGFIRAVDAVAS